MSHRAKAAVVPEPIFKVKDYPGRVSVILRQGKWWVVERERERERETERETERERDSELRI